MKEFVHLHVHSEYSVLDGVMKIEDILNKVEEWDMPAVALTDHGNLFGAIEFYEEAILRGIKPIIGMEAYLAQSKSLRDKTGDYYHITILVENEEGYRNLLRLSTISYLEGFYRKPRIDLETLAQHSKGLIVLSGCIKGPINQNLLKNNKDEAYILAATLKEILGKENFYIELMDLDAEETKILIPALIEISRNLQIESVVTSDAHYLEPQDYLIQEVLLCINTGKKLSDKNRLTLKRWKLHLRSPEEIYHSFRDYPDFVKNTLKIAEKVNLKLDLGNILHIPEFPTPQGYTNNYEFLKSLAEDGLKKRFGGKEVPATYKNQLEYELKIIKDLNFESYFLTIWDITQYAKKNGIPVGPGRGSAVSSLVLYAIGVTEVDPLKYGLLFERFLNPGRISPPDVDIDFSDTKRDLVIDYVKKRFGEKNVAQIITFGRMMSKMVVRDVGRVLGFDYEEVDQIAKKIPRGPDVTLERAIKEISELKELYESSKYRNLFDIALKIEGHVRNTSLHAAGVVITPTEIWNYAPLYRTSQDEISTQYDMRALEKLGLLKIDLLGLKTLTVIDNTEKLIRERKYPEFSIKNIPENDSKTFEMLSRGDTWGVFQLESKGMTQVVKKVKPDDIKDLMAIIALYRPGPIESGEIVKYINRKHGLEPPEYPLDSLKEVLEETYGVVVYQEQVMKIASIVAGYSYEEADELRRAMGKKIKEIMEQQKEIFVKKGKQRGVDENLAKSIFEIIEHFAGYAFNKSHAAGYATISYWTAYLKANFPHEFLVALLNSEMESQDFQKKLAKIIFESKRKGFNILPPDINQSEYGFRLLDNGDILYGLGALKNVGEAAVSSLIEERKRRGSFKSFQEFLTRINPQKVNKRVIESLIKAGAFDKLESNRKYLLELLKTGVLISGGLFPGGVVSKEVSFISPPTRDEILEFEEEILGFYLSTDPIEDQKDLIYSLDISQFLDTEDVEEDEKVYVLGMIKNITQKKSKKGNYYFEVVIKYQGGEIEGIFFGREKDLQDEGIKMGGNSKELFLIVGYYSRQEEKETGRLRIEQIYRLNDVLSKYTRGVYITFEANIEEGDEIVEKLKDLFEKYEGHIPVFFVLPNVGVYRVKNVTVSVPNSFLRSLREIKGISDVKVVLEKSLL